MDISSEVSMTFTLQNQLCKKKKKAYVFIFVRKIKSHSKIVAHLISVNWAPPTPRVIWQYEVLSWPEWWGMGVLLWSLVSTGPCCSPPVCGYVKLGCCPLKKTIFFFYWSIVDWQCYVSFKWIAKWLSYTYTYSFSKFFSHLGYYRILSRVPCIIQ